MSEGKAEKKKREDPKSRHDKMPRKANLDPIQLPRGEEKQGQRRSPRKRRSTTETMDHSHQESPLVRESCVKPAPFWDDPEAVAERNACDYDIRISLDMAQEGKAPRRIRVYADGIYDLFHGGHARQLMQAKTVFSNVYLIVGVCSDKLTRERKGCTVMDEHDRYEGVRHCRYVDEVVHDAPWSIDDDFLQTHKIDFVAHDDIPYTTGSAEDVYASLKARGMFVATERTEGISTSDIVARIVRDYDLYVRRNLARGYTAKDLNVSFIKEKRFRLQNKMTEMLGRGKSVVGKVGGKGQEVLSRWEEKSWEYINNFLLFFGKEGIGNIWKEGKSIVRQALSPPSSPGSSSPPTSHNGNSSPDLSQCPPYKMRRCNEDPEEYSEDEDEEMPCSTKADAVSS